MLYSPLNFCIDLVTFSKIKVEMSQQNKKIQYFIHSTSRRVKNWDNNSKRPGLSLKESSINE